MNLGVRRDLVASLEKHHCSDDQDLKDSESPCKKLKRDPESRKTNLDNLTEQTLFMLRNRLASSRVSETLHEASEVLKKLQRSSSSSSSLDKGLEETVHRTTLTRHTLILDGAVDRCTSDEIFMHRDDE